MAIYGLTPFGFRPPDGWYGFGYGPPAANPKVEPTFRIEPFTAQSRDYQTIQVSWTQPAATATQGITAYRLIRNRFGYPMDQNDGQILVDSLTYPGSYFMDTQVTPGKFHYYGFYVQLANTMDVWIRSGLTACLANQDFNMQDWLLERIPNFFTSNSFSTDELGPDVTQNQIVDSFMNVVAWGLNYLKTQYNTYTQVNNPWFIPLDDLYNLAAELGININPDISAYTLRKAIFFNAVINEQRGTLPGIEQEVSALTGWNSDIRVSQNMMLENDQSNFPAPTYPLWSAGISYTVGERVYFGNYTYQCSSTGNIGVSPTGSNTNNAFWNWVNGTVNNTTLLNQGTANMNTWEAVYSATPYAPAQPMSELVGVQNPLNAGQFQNNSISATNNTGSTAVIDMRSLSRVNLNPNFNFLSSFTPATWTTSTGTFTYTSSPPAGGPSSTAGFFQTTTTGNMFNADTMPATPNTTYVVSAWVYSTVTSVNLGLNFVLNSGSITTVSNAITVVANTWTQITTSVTSPAATSGLQGYLAATTGTQNVYVELFTAYQQSASALLPYAPDAAQAIGDGIPVPYSLPYQIWNATTRYVPNQIVTFNSQPFICTWGNTGITPPYNTIGTTNFEWAPLSFSPRYRVCISGYVYASTTGVTVTPFTELFDQYGKPVQRVLARNTTPGLNGTPPNLFYDSFTAGSNNPVSGRTTDDGNGSWVQQTGIYALSPQNSGAIYPVNLNQRSISTVSTSVANGNFGITFISNPVTSQSQGLCLRYVSNTSYIRADMTQLKMNNGGTYTVLGTYSQPATPGDRLTVNLNGSTITCYVNGIQVLQVSSTFNQSATVHGIITEIT